MPISRKAAVGVLTALLALGTVNTAQAADTTPMHPDPGPVGDFSWKGFNWEKRWWSGAPHYNKTFDAANVSDPDANGHITMTLSNPTGNSPVAAEFNTTRHGGWGYGTYSATVEKNLNSLQDEAVWGCLFSYDPNAAPGYTEIDICEASAWGGGKSYGQDWPVTQGHGYWFDASKPAGEGNNTTVFKATNDPVLTHKMVWEPGRITFETYSGEGYSGPLLKRTVLESSTVPVPSPNTTLHFNLWATAGGGGDPDNLRPEQVIVRDFSYAPAPTPSIRSGADIVAYDSAGALWDYGTLAAAGTPRRNIGAAGAPIPKSLFVADWNSDGIQDLIVQEASGSLKYRRGLAGGGFADTAIGGGWQGYDIRVAKWKKTDKYPSIVAKENRTGDLWVYGNASGSGLSPRVKIGAGWGQYHVNLLDWNKDGSIDVVARNAAGEMKLYRTNGAGAFVNERRATIGTGWKMFSHIRTLTGHNGAGTVGLVARDSSGRLYYYQSNKGAWSARKLLGGGWNPYIIAGN